MRQKASTSLQGASLDGAPLEEREEGEAVSRLTDLLRDATWEIEDAPEPEDAPNPIWTGLQNRITGYERERRRYEQILLDLGTLKAAAEEAEDKDRFRKLALLGMDWRIDGLENQLAVLQQTESQNRALLEQIIRMINSNSTNESMVGKALRIVRAENARVLASAGEGVERGGGRQGRSAKGGRSHGGQRPGRQAEAGDER
jgi:hypothetical protein